MNTLPGTPHNIYRGSFIVLDGQMYVAASEPLPSGRFHYADLTGRRIGKTHVAKVEVVDIAELFASLDVARREIAEARARIVELKARPDPEALRGEIRMLRSRVAELEARAPDIVEVEPDDVAELRAENEKLKRLLRQKLNR